MRLPGYDSVGFIRGVSEVCRFACDLTDVRLSLTPARCCAQGRGHPVTPGWRSAPPELPATTWNNEALPTASFRRTKTCLVSPNKEQDREERMGRVHLGALKTSM